MHIQPSATIMAKPLMYRLRVIWIIVAMFCTCKALEPGVNITECMEKCIKEVSCLFCLLTQLICKRTRYDLAFHVTSIPYTFQPRTQGLQTSATRGVVSKRKDPGSFLLDIKKIQLIHSRI